MLKKGNSLITAGVLGTIPRSTKCLRRASRWFTMSSKYVSSLNNGKADNRFPETLLLFRRFGVTGQFSKDACLQINQDRPDQSQMLINKNQFYSIKIILADQCWSLQIIPVWSALIFIDQNRSAMIFIDPHWEQFLKSDVYWSALICIWDWSSMSW